MGAARDYAGHRVRSPMGREVGRSRIAQAIPFSEERLTCLVAIAPPLVLQSGGLSLASSLNSFHR